MLWGVDLGGTKIEGLIFDPSTGKSRARLRYATHAELGYESILARIKDLIEALSRECGEQPRVIGFGTPGALDSSSQMMKQCNTLCLNNKPLKRDLERVLNVPVMLENDANCFVLAESLLGAARGARSAFGIIMGTGVGGGLVIHDALWSGYQGLAGEWGHTVLNPNGEECYCGRRGCVETIISGPALERHYHSISNQKKSLVDICSAAGMGNDIAALDTIAWLCKNFAEALSTVVSIVDPEVVVLGGGVSNVPDLYHEGIACFKKLYARYEVQTKIVKNELGDSAGVFGAALLTK